MHFCHLAHKSQNTIRNSYLAKPNFPSNTEWTILDHAVDQQPFENSKT